MKERSFKNELGNSILISVTKVKEGCVKVIMRGPTSSTEQQMSMSEAKMLFGALGTFLGKRKSG
jgi:hypothetical protein